MIDHEQAVLAGCVPGNKIRALLISAGLTDKHFKSEVPRAIFLVLTRYLEATNGVITHSTLVDILGRSQNVEEAKALLYATYFADLEKITVDDSEWRYSLNCLKEDYEHNETGHALSTSFQIFENGWEVDGEMLRGADAAREYATMRFGEIERLNSVESAPEGDIREESKALIKAYEERRDGTEEPGIKMGIPSLDKSVGGMNPGELIIIAGYANAGKSQWTAQTAWNAAVNQGKNVFFATTETLRSTMHRRIVARHSLLPQFNYPKGLDSIDIQRGTLNPGEESLLRDVLNDLETNPNYGRLHIAQVPEDATSVYVETAMKRANTEWQVDFGIIDYLALLKPRMHRASEREEYNAILRGTKNFCVAFDHGRGIPLLSPWQMRRDAYVEALNRGYYVLSNLADTSEAEKVTDTIYGLLVYPEKKQEGVVSILKKRDGEIPPPSTLKIDFRCAYLGDHSSSNTMANGFGLSGASTIGY